MGESRTALLNVEEAAELLNVSRFTVRKWIRTGQLPVTRLGRAVRFDPQALERFIKRNTSAECSSQYEVKGRTAEALA